MNPKRLAAALLLVPALLFSAPAARAACTPLTTGLQLDRPAIGDNFDVWALCLRGMILQVNDAAVSTTTLQQSTAALKSLIDSLPGGHAIQDEGVDLPFRSTMNFVGAGVTVTDTGGKTVVSITGTSDEVRSTGTVIGERTTSSTGWESVAGSTLSLVAQTSQFLKVEYSCNVECDSNTRCPVAFSYLVDGAFKDGATSSTDSGIMYLETANTITGAPMAFGINHKSTFKLSPGTRNITLLWASPGGVPIRMGRKMGGCSLRYSEAPEQFNAGSAAVVSGATNLGAQSQVSLQGLVCPVLPCQAQGSFGTYDLWVATGTGPGQWMNARTGTGP